MSVSQPLPESLRPEDFAAFVGQEHLAARIKSLLSAPPAQPSAVRTSRMR